MKSIKYFGLLLILPLITMALTTNYIIEADAEKGQGVHLVPMVLKTKE